MFRPGETSYSLTTSIMSDELRHEGDNINTEGDKKETTQKEQKQTCGQGGTTHTNKSPLFTKVSVMTLCEKASRDILGELKGPCRVDAWGVPYRARRWSLMGPSLVRSA